MQNPKKRKASETSTQQRQVAPRNTLHEVAVPNGYKSKKDSSIHGTLMNPVFKGERARNYSFQLDEFEEICVSCLERQELMVSTHKSAPVVEYAIAMALRDKQELIYTSPLAALINQRYKDFDLMSGGDVGLMTGDESLSPTPSCLLMTTEILRKFILTRPQILDGVACVLFDDVHYMKVRERGLVWEEIIMLLPRAIKMVFLSATMSNAFQFAQWICNIRRQPCHVVHTGFRPTPLRHYAYPLGSGRKILLVDEAKEFIQANFLELQNNITEEEKQKQIEKDLKWENEIKRVVKITAESEHLPVIIFSFSKRQCEKYALSISRYTFNNETEKKKVEQIFQKVILCLSEEDRKLSPVKDMLPFLKYGIAVHHSGLLPIIKELVETLFQEGLLKVLFATETFAMGLNRFAKTVVLTSAKKGDDDSKRYVESGEYIQMSGRAGLHGQEECGECIIMIDEQIKMNTLRDMVLGEPAPLVSAFRLSFNLILNLMGQCESQFNADHLIQHSFIQFQAKQASPNLGNMIAKLEEEVANLNASGGVDDAGYNKLKLEYSDLEKNMLAEMTQYPRCFEFLVPGRLVKVENDGTDIGWGVVKWVKRTGSNYLVDILQRSIGSSESIGQKDEMQVVSLPFSSLSALAKQIIRLPRPAMLGSLEERRILLELRKLEKKFPQGFQKLDPLEVPNHEHNPVFVDLVKQIKELEVQLSSHPSAKVQKLRKEIQQLKTKKADSQLEKFRVELKNRLEVLKKLEHIDAQHNLTVKGRAARLIRTGDGLLAIEAIINATFNDLDGHEIAALASCFILGYKSQQVIQVSSKLDERLENLRATAREIAKIQHECKLEVDVEEYVEAIVSPVLMNAIYSWATGSSFSDITTKTDIVTTKTDIWEGDIISLARRLREFLNQLCCAAQAVGEAILAEKFVAAGESIHRGIMVANPGYQDN